MNPHNTHLNDVVVREWPVTPAGPTRRPEPWSVGRRSAIASLVIALGLAIGSTYLEAGAAPLASPYIIVGATQMERELFADVYDSYQTAELELPGSIHVEFTDRGEPCNGNNGMYTYAEHKIVFCRPAEGEWLWLRRLIIHELGHAWDDHNMSEMNRCVYMIHIGYDQSSVWFDQRLPHDQRPGERFPGTISGLLQGLIDQDRFETLIGGVGSEGGTGPPCLPTTEQAGSEFQQSLKHPRSAFQALLLTFGPVPRRGASSHRSIRSGGRK